MKKRIKEKRRKEKEKKEKGKKRRKKSRKEKGSCGKENHFNPFFYRDIDFGLLHLLFCDLGNDSVCFLT